MAAGNIEPEMATLRRSQDRTLEREGIPMVLALVSEIGPLSCARDPAVGAEGRRLAAVMDRYRAALLSSSRDDDLGCVISVLQAVSYADFAGPGASLDETDVDIVSRRAGQ